MILDPFSIFTGIVATILLGGVIYIIVFCAANKDIEGENGPEYKIEPLYNGRWKLLRKDYCPTLGSGFYYYDDATEETYNTVEDAKKAIANLEREPVFVEKEGVK